MTTHNKDDIIALQRANDLIDTMSSYIAKMALPATFFYNLNEHFLYMSKLKRENIADSKSTTSERTYRTT